MKPNRPLPIAAMLLALSFAILLLAAGCEPRSSVSARPVAIMAAASAYLGNAACVECHSSVCQKHGASRHAATLTAGGRRGLGRLAPPVGRVPGTKYRVVEKGDGLVLTVDGNSHLARRIDLAVGSGKFGVTYMSVGNNYMERLRMSYFPSLRKWYLHPGEEGAELYGPPGKFDAAQSRRCLGCHSTVGPDSPGSAGSIVPKLQFFGVGCESCHGPGSAHVAAARAGSRSLHIEKIGSWGATRINDLCGRCHGKEGASTSLLLSKTDTQRFAANALMQSRCFWQSHDNFSCLSCHDSHADASHDRSQYDAVCLKCHATENTAATGGKPCPVNGKEKCTSCHMKTGKFLEHSDIPTEMTDHYIRPPRTSARLP